MTGWSASRTSDSVGSGMLTPGGRPEGARPFQVGDDDRDVRGERQKGNPEEGRRGTQLDGMASEESDGQPHGGDPKQHEAGHLEPFGGEIRELRKRPQTRAARIDGLPCLLYT